jgi:hypothetical protein
MLDPSTVQGAIVWGVISGLATSALLVLVGLFLSRVLLPAYLNFIYQGVDLRGVWTYETTMTPSGRFAVQLSLDQQAHKLSGTASITQSGTGTRDYVQFFSVDGSTWEGFLMLNMRSSNRKSLSFVAGLFKIKGRGESLEGHWVFRSSSSDTANSEPLHLIRQAKA